MTARKKKKKPEYARVICSISQGPIKGTWDKCSECAVEIYLSDSTREQAKTIGVSLILFCSECGVKQIPDDAKMVGLSGVQKGELERFLGKSDFSGENVLAAMRLHDLMKRGPI